MAFRNQNDPHPHGRVPGYYANNNIYPGAYAPIESQTRVSRRIHDGFVLNDNYGLDTTSDDINSSPFSSPYYINGRFNSDNLTTQRGNSASVQGTKFLISPFDRLDDFKEEDAQCVIEMWQGKQIRFELPYSGKVVGNTISIKNTDECTGLLSIYFSLKPNAQPVYETCVDLCKISSDKFDHIKLHSMTVVPQRGNPEHKLYVRMEIWNEISQERSTNPFNTGRKIEILGTGLSGHSEYIEELCDKNIPSNREHARHLYKPQPSRPLVGLVYNDYQSVPTDRIDNIKAGASVSLNGYRYDIFCVKNDNSASVLVYDKEMNQIIPSTIRVDGRVEQLSIAQVTDTQKQTWVYYVDGFSPLQRFKIGEWNSESFPSGSADKVRAEVDNKKWGNSPLGDESGLYVFTYTNGSWEYNNEVISLDTYGITLSGGSPSEGSTITVSYTVSSGGTKIIESIKFVDARPVIAASIIVHHNNRLYLAGFRHDPNLMQISAIDKDGPNYTLFPYRMYVPNRSPYDTSLDPITAIVEYTTDELMVMGRSSYTRLQSNTNIEDGTPQQVSSYMDSAGVQSQGDLVNYKGVLYSFDEKEGIRRYSGATWLRIPTSVDSHYDRVDMNYPRKLWGYANKLYLNYTDAIDHRKKCLIWDMNMNYQQYPWFQDIDVPFCDVRYDEKEDLIGIHPDYPCIMNLYAEDTWARLDTPIYFRRDSKFLSIPGNAADLILKRVHVKVLNNANRWWYVAINKDRQEFTQKRGLDSWYRQPVWDTLLLDEPTEDPFSFEDPYEENSIYRMTLSNLKIRASSIQVRVKTKTFRRQANLISVVLEVAPRQYN